MSGLAKWKATKCSYKYLTCKVKLMLNTSQDTEKKTKAKKKILNMKEKKNYNLSDDLAGVSLYYYISSKYTHFMNIFSSHLFVRSIIDKEPKTREDVQHSISSH